jgi:hypothetical protein
MSEQKKIREEYVLDENLRWRLEKSDMGQDSPKKRNSDEQDKPCK